MSSGGEKDRSSCVSCAEKFAIVPLLFVLDGVICVAGLSMILLGFAYIAEIAVSDTAW